METQSVKTQRVIDLIAAGLSNLVYYITPDKEGTMETMGDFEVHIESVLTNANIQCCILMLTAQNCAFITFRGTQSFADWKVNIQTSRINFLGHSERDRDIRVHEGYYRSYLEPSVVPDKSGDTGCVIFTPSIHDQVLGAIDRILSMHANIRHVIFTGHSLGGALATLSLASVFGLENYGTRMFESVETSLVTFGSPRLGCPGFANLVSSFIAKLRRYVAVSRNGKKDIVTTVPSTKHRSFSKETFKHVVEELVVPTNETSLLAVHGIETYIKHLQFMFNLEHISLQPGFELLEKSAGADPAVDSLFDNDFEPFDLSRPGSEDCAPMEDQISQPMSKLSLQGNQDVLQQSQSYSTTSACLTTTSNGTSSTTFSSESSSSCIQAGRRSSLYSHLLQEVRIMEMIYHDSDEPASGGMQVTTSR